MYRKMGKCISFGQIDLRNIVFPLFILSMNAVSLTVCGRSLSERASKNKNKQGCKHRPHVNSWLLQVDQVELGIEYLFIMIINRDKSVYV